jgi:hypothetical protein
MIESPYPHWEKMQLCALRHVMHELSLHCEREQDEQSVLKV